jgi:subtilase family serine protease
MLAVLAPLVALTGSCSGPAITAAGVQSTHDDGDVRHYDIAITVTNHGSAAVPASVLDSVEIYQDGTKVDQKGLPWLKPGQSATVRYDFQRASDARRNSTQLRLRLVQRDPHGTAVTPCGGDAAGYRLSV